MRVRVTDSMTFLPGTGEKQDKDSDASVGAALTCTFSLYAGVAIPSDEAPAALFLPRDNAAVSVSDL